MAGTIYVGANINEPLYIFTGADMISCSCVLSSSLSGDELAIDQFMPVVYSGGVFLTDFLEIADKSFYVSSDSLFFCVKSADKRYPDSIPYGTPIYYYNSDNELIGKFYSQRIVRTARNQYSVSAVSAIGIMEGQMHNGGLYNGESFADVATDIIGGSFSFTCAADVAQTLIFGWLPIDTKRANLHQLLFATGAALYKDANGEIYFSFPDADTVNNIPSNRIFYGGSVDYMEPATKAEITEHTYRTSNFDETVTLFDNSASSYADNVFVSFQAAPIYDLATTGTLQVISSGANYAIVSGIGALTGKKYAHITRVISKDRNLYNTPDKTVSVTNATLVNEANSENVLQRVLSFYSSARTIKNSIILANEQAGAQVSFENPYGEVEQAFIASLDINETSFMRADCEMVTGYVPTGGGNNYTDFVLLTGSGTWTIPAEVFDKDLPIIRATLIGGGQGGQSGANGENGGQSAPGDTTWEEGGAGGSAGDGGAGGKIYSITIDCTGLVSLAYSCGGGGAGATGGTGITDGALGAATTFDSSSSESGQAADLGIVNIFTGDVYGSPGTLGVNGGNGGTRWGSGESITYEGVTYIGGAPGANAEAASGGAGGGAAVGANGGDGKKGIDASFGGSGGDGGAGGSAIARTAATGYGNGGNGGHGGGGGGAGGLGAAWSGDGGAGGRGGNGGAAAPGCVLIYF